MSTTTDAAQYITPTYVTFANEWDKLAEASSVTETFALSSSESLKGKSVYPLV
jgi:coatomer protein complex subunit gamma